MSAWCTFSGVLWPALRRTSKKFQESSDNRLPARPHHVRDWGSDELLSGGRGEQRKEAHLFVRHRHSLVPADWRLVGVWTWVISSHYVSCNLYLLLHKFCFLTHYTMLGVGSSSGVELFQVFIGTGLWRDVADQQVFHCLFIPTFARCLSILVQSSFLHKSFASSSPCPEAI